MKRRNGLAIVFLTALIMTGAGSAKGAVASGQTEYTFSGTCADCRGFGVGDLILSNYTPGASGDISNFLSFNYHSSLIAFSIAQSVVSYFSVVLGTVPGPADVLISTNVGNLQFDSFTFGLWCTGKNCGEDYGYASTWSAASTAVPEPGSMMLLLSALAGLVAVSRWKPSLR